MKKSVNHSLPMTNSLQMLVLEQRGRRREQQSKPSQPSQNQDSI